jgi:integrase/recombinase XerD
MLEELRRRNFATTTIESYIHGVEHFSQYFHRPPDQLGPEHIRQYQAMLFTELKLSPNTVIVRLAALRFFYIHVLKRNWSIAETPYPKKVLHLPQVLSQEEVARLIDAAEFPLERRSWNDSLGSLIGWASGLPGVDMKGYSLVVASSQLG